MLAAARLRFQNGDFAGAMDLCRLALQRDGRIQPVLQLLESMAWESASHGRYDQTATCFELMLSHSPDSADLHFNLAAILLRLGDRPRVIDALRNATRYRPDWIDAFYYLALTLQEAGDFQEAATQWRRVLELKPDHGSALFNLGVVLERLGETDQAQDCYQRARNCVPTTLLCMDLGLKNLEEGRTAQAIEDLTKATAMDPNCAIAWMNLGVALMRDGKISDSLSAFDASLRLEPWRPEAHWNRAPALLIVGNFNAGWQEYEWRSRCHEFSTKIRKVDRPMWRGEEIRGKTILLHDEQGFGDTFQFVRYAPLLAERGAKVILLCKGPVAALLCSVPAVSQVVADGQPCPHVDFHSPMPSLPFLFGTTLETIPANTPYLSADPALVGLWAKRLPASGGNSRIGIAWAGNVKPNRYRSIPANLLGPLMGIDGILFYSLQKQIEDLSVQPPQGMPIHDFSAQIRDFSDTAALIANMDLVITIDTSVAHLAGSMGKRVWILLPTSADWRWLTNRDDSPWYPNARLFRQQKAGDWPDVIGRVAKELILDSRTIRSGKFANSPSR
jgi:tetratricopeptide (TPR) repeat protein